MDQRARDEEGLRHLLAELERSGESVAAFARRRQLSAWRLYEARRRLRQGMSLRPDGGARVRPASPSTPARFAAVRVGDSRRVVDGFEVAVGAMSVAVPPGFDAGELARLLRVLSAC